MPNFSVHEFEPCQAFSVWSFVSVYLLRCPPTSKAMHTGLIIRLLRLLKWSVYKVLSCLENCLKLITTTYAEEHLWIHSTSNLVTAAEDHVFPCQLRSGLWGYTSKGSVQHKIVAWSDESDVVSKELLTTILSRKELSENNMREWINPVQSTGQD